MRLVFSSGVSFKGLLEAIQVSSLIILIMLAGPPASAQRVKKKEIGPREEAGGVNLAWSQGSVILDDGTEHTGLVKYNENTATLYFKKDDEVRTLTAKKCVGFEFWDIDQEEQRMFISLEYGDTPSQVFFEALFQFRAFAVLRTGMMNLYYSKESANTSTIQTPTGALPIGGTSPGGKFKLVKRYETFYLMSELGEIKPFVSHYSKDRTGDGGDRTSAEVYNEDFLLRLIGQQAYDDLARFQKENDLEFTKEEDMMKIFEYYRERWSEQ